MNRLLGIQQGSHLNFDSELAGLTFSSGLRLIQQLLFVCLFPTDMSNDTLFVFYLFLFLPLSLSFALSVFLHPLYISPSLFHLIEQLL